MLRVINLAVLLGLLFQNVVPVFALRPAYASEQFVSSGVVQSTSEEPHYSRTRQFAPTASPSVPAHGTKTSATGTATTTPTPAAGGRETQTPERVFTPAPTSNHDNVIKNAGDETYLPIVANGRWSSEDEVWEGDIDETGGSIEAFDDAVRVEFPAGAVTDTVHVRVQTSDDTNHPSYLLGGFPFEIEAESLVDHRPVDTFSAEVTLRVAYDPQRIAGAESQLSLFYYDEELSSWVPLPTEVDTTANYLTARTTHFTNFDVNAQKWEAATLPSVKSSQVQSFTGAGTHSYPIQVPAGPAGLQPDVSLTYNSQAVDKANNRTQASWVGMGWSLNTGYIQRDTRGTYDELDDDVFILNVNGVSSVLLPADDGTYHTADEHFWRIEYDGGDPKEFEAQDGTWTIWDKQGNTYVLGANEPERASFPVFFSCDENRDDHAYVTWQWSLSRKTNTFGKSLRYTYHHETKNFHNVCGYSNRPGDVAVYPATIIYPHERYRIKFERAGDRTDYDEAWETGYYYTSFKRSRLTDIRIQHDADDDGTFEQNIRRYELRYASDAQERVFPNVEWPQGGHTLTLVGIQEYGLNDSDTLPATTFAYDDGMHLTDVHNGYGGRVRFEYAPWHSTKWDREQHRLPGHYRFGEYCHGIVEDWETVTGRMDCESDRTSDGERYTWLELFAEEHAPAEIETDFDHRFSPGTVYKITGDFKRFTPGTWAQVGIEDAESSQVQIGAGDHTRVSVETRLEGAASDPHLVIRCSDRCKVWDLEIVALPTRYRVAQKQITDDVTGKTHTFRYRYDEPAMNDEAHSTGAATEHPYTSANTEFRGHALVQEIGPDGRVTASWFRQSDALSGRTVRSQIGTQAFWDAFDTRNTDAWRFSPAGRHTIERLAGDGALKTSNPDNRWDTTHLARSAYSLNDGDIVQLQFRVEDPGTESRLAVESTNGNHFGIWITPTDAGPQRVDLWRSDGAAEILIPANQFKVDAWYILQLGVDDDRFLLRLWERDGGAVHRVQTPMPAGKAWRFHQWTRRGTIWLDTYSEGTLLSETETGYSVAGDADTGDDAGFAVDVDTDQVPTCDDEPCGDLNIRWVRPAYKKQLTFEQDAEFVGRLTEFQYKPADQHDHQYGNQTRVIEKRFDDETFVPYRATRKQFYPTATDSIYLVGLPGYENTYACPDGTCDFSQDTLKRSTQHLYDGSRTYSDNPERGIQTGMRTFVCFIDQDGECGEYHEDTSARFQDASFEYGAWGNTVQQIQYRNYGTATSFAADMPAEQRDPVTVTTTYDPAYHTYKVAQTNAAGHVTEWAYSDAGFAFGVPTSMIDANDNPTTAKYDEFGRLIEIRRPYDRADGKRPTVAIEYHDERPFWTAVHQKRTEEIAQTVRKFYDGLGQLIQTQTANVLLDDGTRADVVVDTTYDAYGKKTRVTVPYTVTPPSSGWHGQNLEHSATTTAYDAFGRPIAVVAPDGTQQTYSYDDLIKTVTDPKQRTTRTETDIFGRTTRVVPPTGPTLEYTHDALDQLVQVTKVSTDSQRLTTSIVYDAAGRKLAMEDPDMGTWTYTYDAAGNLLTQTDARNIVTHFRYDRLNRVREKWYIASASADADMVLVPEPVRHFYDEGGASENANGQRTRMVDGAGTTTWQYDARGRVTNKTRVIDDVGTYELAYTYDSADTAISLTYPDGEVVTTGYDDGRGLPASLSSSLGDTFVADAGYDANNRTRRLMLGNGIETVYDYYRPEEQGGRLHTLRTSDDSLNLAYRYDAVGNIDEIIDASTSIGSQRLDFEYDALDRLTEAQATGGAIPGYDIDYRYDALGRLDQQTEFTRTLNYTYSAEHPHAAVVFDDNSYTYDAAGNMTQRVEDGITYIQYWTPDNKLARVTWSEDGRPYTTTFAYDGDGNRLLKIEGMAATQGPAEVTTAYIGGIYEEQVDTTDQKLSERFAQTAADRRQAVPSGEQATAAGIDAVSRESSRGLRRARAHRPGLAALTRDAGIPRRNDPPASTGAKPVPQQSEQRTATWTTKSDFLTDGGNVRQEAGIERYDVDGSLRLLSFGDDFNDSELNLDRWETSTAQEFLERNGRLERGDSIDHYGVTLRQSDPLRGDFSIQVDYGMLEWAADLSPRLALELHCQNGNNATIQYAATDEQHTSNRIEAWFNDPVDSALREDTPHDGDESWETGTLGVERNGTTWTLSYKRASDSTFSPLLRLTESEIGGGAFGACQIEVRSGQWYGFTSSEPFKSFNSYFDNVIVHENDSVAGWQYLSSGTWRTEVDGGHAGKMDWQRLIWGAGSKPANTAAKFRVRSCEGAYGAACGAWQTTSNVEVGDDVDLGTLQYRRYLQVEAQLTSNGANAATPIIDQLALDYAADLEAPATPGSATVTPAGIENGQWQDESNSPSFTWTAPADDLTGVAGYTVYWGRNPNGTSSDFQTATEYTPAPVSADGTYYLRVRTVDNVGNAAPWTTLFTFKYDDTSPEPPDTVNAEPADVSDGRWQNVTDAPTFTWTGARDSTSGIQGYDVYWDTAETVGTPTETNQAINNYAAENVASGDTYYLYVRSRDRAGNVSNWVKLFTFKYDRTPPQNPPADSATDTNGSTSGTWQNAISDPSFAWEPGGDEESGVAGYRVYWGGDSAGVSNDFTASASYDPPAVSDDGIYYLRVATEDTAGNRASWTTLYTFTFDSTAPTVPRVTESRGAQNDVWQNRTNQPAFIWNSATDASSGVAGYRLYWGTDVAGISTDSPVNTSEFSPTTVSSGEATYLRMQTEDEAGNRSPWKTVFTFKYDGDAPTISNVRPANSIVITDTQPRISADLSDLIPGSGVVPAETTLIVDGDVVTPQQSTPDRIEYVPSQPLDAGRHFAALQIEDGAGNTSATNWDFTVDPATWVDITAPADGTVINNRHIPLRIDLEQQRSIRLTVTTPVTTVTDVVDNGYWQLDGLPLQTGTNAITVDVQDAAGNTAVDTTSVTVDPAAHTALITANSDVVNPTIEDVRFDVTARAGSGYDIRKWDAKIRAPDGTIVATFTGNSAADGQLVVWDGRDSGGDLVPDGVYTYTLAVEVTDSVTIETATSLPGRLQIRTAPPVTPTLYCDSNSVWFSVPPALVKGTAPVVSEHVVVSLDGTPAIIARVSEAGNWKAPLPLADSDLHTAHVTAIDAAGNESAPSSSCEVGLSLSEPFIIPHASLSHTYVGLDTTVALTATTRTTGGAPAETVWATLPPGQRTVTMTEASTGMWTESWQTPRTVSTTDTFEGVAVVQFDAEDVAVPVPNHGAQFVQPYLDLVAPETRLTQPVNGHTFTSNSVRMAGRTEPLSTIIVRAVRIQDALVVTDTVASTALGRWQIALPLGDGTYSISAYAVDRAGNVGSPTEPLTVLVDTNAPTIGRLDVPSRYIQPNNNIVVTTTVTDTLSGVDRVQALVVDLPAAGQEKLLRLIADDGNTYSSGLNLGAGTTEGQKPVTLQARDVAGNEGERAAGSLVIDGTPPAVGDPAFTLEDTSANVYLADSNLLYYGPASTGDVAVEVETGDSAVHTTSGIASITFPSLFTNNDGLTLTLDGATAPATYTYRYPVDATQSVSTTGAVRVEDRAGNATTSSAVQANYDATPPALSGLDMRLSGASSQITLDESTRTVYYGANAAGKLHVAITAEDAGAGLRTVTFPDLFDGGADYDGAGVRGPHHVTHTYTLSGNESGRPTQLTAVDTVGNVSAGVPLTTVQDLDGPRVTVTATRTTGTHVAVSWAGADAASGVDTYDVQYRDGDAEWIPWFTDIVSTTAEFIGIPGHEYAFRVRARDRVANTGSWQITTVSGESTTVTKYYTLGDRRVAMRRGDEVTYLQGDHLRSVSLATDENGDVLSEVRYTPFGQERWRAGAAGGRMTDFGYTGQRLEAGFGLMDYNARYYDPMLGRFISPDTIVPEPAKTSAFDRYGYAYNNPVRYNDPTGHCAGACVGAIIAGGLLALKAIDYGWTAYDAWQAGRTLNDPNATPAEKSQAAAALAMTGAAELAEPDELLPVALPVDDLARKGVFNSDDIASGLRRFKELTAEAIPDVMKSFGDEVRVAGNIPDHLTERRVTTIGKTDDTEIAEEIGERILQVAEDEDWSKKMNHDWLSEAIDNGDVFYLASPVNSETLTGAPWHDGISVFTRELDALLQAEYQRVGDYLIPPN